MLTDVYLGPLSFCDTRPVAEAFEVREPERVQSGVSFGTHWDSLERGTLGQQARCPDVLHRHFF